MKMSRGGIRGGSVTADLCTEEDLFVGFGGMSDILSVLILRPLLSGGGIYRPLPSVNPDTSFVRILLSFSFPLPY